MKNLKDLKDVFSKENLEKIITFLDKNGDKIEKFIDKHGDLVVSAIDEASGYIKKKTPVFCELINVGDKLDMNNLKQVIRDTMTPESEYAALLNLGRNKKDELEFFLQHLDKDKKAISLEKVYCIRCEMQASEIKEAFGGKELLVIKL